MASSSDALPEDYSQSHELLPQNIPATPKNMRRFAVPLVIVLILGLLGGVYLYVTQQVNTKVTADHAEHQEMSPSVHDIVHVRQKLVVGTDTNFKPMEFTDPKTGERVGFDIDLGKAIAKELNVPVVFETIDFDSVFAPENLGKSNALTQGKVDLMLDSISITPERSTKYLFSKSYLNAGQVIVTRSDVTTITVAEDLRGKKIAVAESTSNEKQALTYTSSDKVLRIKEPDDQAIAVLSKKADAMLVDLTNAKGLIDSHPGLHITSDPLTDDNYGIVIAKGKDDLLTEVNGILDTLRQRGILESLKQKWLE